MSTRNTDRSDSNDSDGIAIAGLLARWQVGIDLLAELGRVPTVAIARNRGDELEVAIVNHGGGQWLPPGARLPLAPGQHARLAGAITRPLRRHDGSTFAVLIVPSPGADGFTDLFLRMLTQLAGALEAGLAALDESERLHREIAARRAAEQALLQRKQLHNEAQRIAKLGHWHHNLQTDELVWSDEMYRLYGIEPAQGPATYDELLTLVHPVDRRRLDEEFRRAVTSRTLFRFTYRLQMADGRIKWLSARAESVYDEDGRPLYSTGTTQDVTARMQAEIALKESEELHREAQKLANVGHWRLDLLTNELQWSDQLFAIFEIDKEKFGASYEAFLQLIPEEERAGLDEVYARSVAEHTDYTWEHRMIMPDGRVKWIFERAVTHYADDGTPLVSIGTAQDITQQKEEERARKAAEQERAALETQLLHVQKLESLGLMAGGIAHDFNNILQAVIGNLELLEVAADADESSRIALQRARQGAMRAAEITAQLLTFAGRDVQPKQLLDLGQIVEEGAQLMRAVIDKRIHLQIEPRRGTLPVNGVPGQVQQVLVNLVTNAAEAIADGKGTIAVSCYRLAPDSPELAKLRRTHGLDAGDYVVMEVRDSGCGMNEATRARLFDPFFTSKTHGRGLGMASVLGIVRAHQGVIDVDSQPGRGTRIRALLPRSAEMPAAGASDTVSTAAFADRRSRILLVDDDESIRIVGAALLQRRGVDVMVAASGHEAIRLLQESGDAFDCVILDLTMPDVDGAEVFRFLRQSWPTLPVLLASGFDRAEALRRIPACAHTTFLRKPWRGEELFKAIGSLINRTI